MPDIKIICEKCGSDRFIASAENPAAEVVSAIVCRTCSHPVKTNEVIIFKEMTYITGLFGNPAPVMPQFSEADI